LKGQEITMQPLQGIHTLIVDDDAASILVLKKLLEHYQVGVTIVSDVQNIEEILNEISHVDVAFLDLEMPIHNGYDILSFLQEQPDFQDTKFIAYTTHTGHMNNARQAGFHGFLGKPINSRTFLENLERILNGEPVWESF
jgi:two-component system cell cycle response regulator DivK